MFSAQKTILLVEDDAIIALNQKRQLENRGYSIIHAINGETAVTIVKKAEQEIDLILMDIDLGKGIEGTQAAEQILKIKELPILFLSSHTEKEIVEKTESISSYGYVVKNSSITVIDASVKMAFKLFAAHKEILKHKFSAEKANINLKTINKNLKTTNTKLRRLDRAIQNTKDIIFITDTDGTITYINSQFTKTYGYTKEEVVGKLNPRILSPDSFTDKENKDFWAMVKEKLHFQIQYKNITKTGELIDIESTIDPIFDEDGKLVEFVQIHRDISEKILTEKNISRGNDYLSFLSTIASDQANATNFDNLTELIIDQLKNITNAIFVTFTEYVSTEKKLKNLKISAAQPILNLGIKLVGAKILRTEIPVDNAFYQEMVTKRIKTFPSLFEDTNGAISLKIALTLQKALKIDKVWGLSYTIDNTVYGTSAFAVKKDQQAPDRKVLDSFINISSISIRRLLLEKELRDSEKETKKYLNAIDSMDLGLFIVNEDYTVRYMNATMIKWFGDQTNLICYKAVAGLTNPCPYCRLKEIIRTGENVIYTPTTEDGRTFNIHASLLTNADGTVSKLEIIQDITELTTANKQVETLLEEKEIILKEVHHRIKNNMMTIMGLLTFQEQSFSDEKTIEAFENTRNRVQSMMVLYDKLYRSKNYQNIWIKDYFETLLKDILAGFQNKKTANLNCKIEDIQMETKIVFNLGIIINELITNSMKYAIDKGTDILISVSILQVNKLITFTIKDNGKGFPNTKNLNKSGGFGLELVKILSEQISADISFANDNGAKVSIKIKNYT